MVVPDKYVAEDTRRRLLDMPSEVEYEVVKRLVQEVMAKGFVDVTWARGISSFGDTISVEMCVLHPAEYQGSRSSERNKNTYGGTLGKTRFY
jgi:hypothetical protein